MDILEDQLRDRHDIANRKKFETELMKQAWNGNYATPAASKGKSTKDAAPKAKPKASKREPSAKTKVIAPPAPTMPVEKGKGKGKTFGKPTKGKSKGKGKSKSRPNSPVPGQRKPCAWFQVSKCVDHKCPWAHVIVKDPTEKQRLQALRELRPRPATPGPEASSKGPCKFWAQGHCVHGNECQFTHLPEHRGLSPSAKSDKGKAKGKGKKGKPRSLSPKGKGKSKT